MKSDSVSVYMRFPRLFLLLILISSGLLLGFSLPFRQPYLLIFLILLFITTAALIKADPFRCLLVFVFAFPLLPSHPYQLNLPDFTYYEFWFLALAFCWAWKRLWSRPVEVFSGFLNLPLAFFLFICFLCTFFGLLRSNLILSDIFVLKLWDQRAICFPGVPFGDLVSLRSFLTIAEGITFFAITQDILKSKRKVVPVLQAYYYAAIGVAFLGILQFIFKFRLLKHWVEANPNLTRMNSTLSDPNALGTYLVCLLAIGIALMLFGDRKQARRYWPGHLLLAIAVIMTASRTAWVSALVLLFFPIVHRWLRSANPEKWQKPLRAAVRWAAGIVCVLIVLVSVATILDKRAPQPESLSDVVLTTLNPNVSANVVLKGRLSLWKSAIRIFKDHPLFGVGMGLYPSTQSTYPYYETGQAINENAHNYFLQLMAETGSFGAFFFAVVLLAAIMAAIPPKGSSQENLLLRYGILLGVLTFLIGSLAGHPLLLVKMQFVFWGLMACMTTLIPQPNRGSKRTEHRLLAFVVVIALFVSPMEAATILDTRDILPYEFGFHEWEKADAIRWRWTGPQALSARVAYGKVLEMKMRQVDPSIDREPSSIRLYLNDELLDVITFADNDWKKLSYYVPSVNVGQQVRLRIQADRIFVPKDFGMPDPRVLGIMLQRIRWRYHPVESIGTYPPEQDQSSRDSFPFQWTRKQASFPLDRGGSVLLVPIMGNPSTLDTPMEVRFFWYGQLLKTVSLRDLKWQVIELTIPEPLRRRGILTICVSHLWNPFQAQQLPDDRDLGVAVGPIRWN